MPAESMEEVKQVVGVLSGGVEDRTWKRHGGMAAERVDRVDRRSCRLAFGGFPANASFVGSGLEESSRTRKAA